MKKIEDITSIGHATCENCMHYKSRDKDLGECYRYPPILFADSDGEVFFMRPQVENNEGACGEFRGKQ